MKGIKGINQTKGQISGILSPLLEKIRLSKVLKWVKGERILDYGCGYGRLAEFLAEKEYVGIDINEEIIRQVRKIYAKKENVKFYTLEEFKNVREMRFDTVVLAAVIEHIENPLELLSTLRRVLAKEGRIIITTPTPFANKILAIGSKFRIFSREAFEEHKVLLKRDDFVRIAEKVELVLEHYER